MPECEAHAHVGGDILWQGVNVTRELDLLLSDKAVSAVDRELTGLGNQREGDLISGTVAAAAYC